MNVIFVAIGGALGAVARFLSFEVIMKMARFSNFANFPLATIFVNILGSLLAGILYYFIIKNFNDFDPRLKNLLMFGFLGAFTTFSAFSIDVMRLMQSGNVTIALSYIFLSVFFCILAVFLGFYLMKVIF
tara:strand:- start:861 stop:1250 length:390 start_codon:yes stop_codon:yes gene_type:complete